MFSMMKKYIIICRMNINNSKRFWNCFKHCTIKENCLCYDCEYWSTNVLNLNWILILTNSAFFLMIMKFWYFLCERHRFRIYSIAKKRRRKFDSSIVKHFRHARFKFIELLFRRANFAKTRHDLIDTEVLYEWMNKKLYHKYWMKNDDVFIISIVNVVHWRNE
jgi:hypothetical protein